MLREITAIIRANRWKPTAEALWEAGFPALTRQRVFGRGRQKGLRYSGDPGSSSGIGVLPKWMLTLVVEDARVDAALAAICKANRSGMIGDGKIFITRLDQVTRLSDGAEDAAALGLGPDPSPEAGRKEELCA
ncbi:MAG TPA: P-II family nitrogen regulator [bacterium]|jgi:nitrogen regulatory protein PII 2|nr:P-II family nitrogen regulator [bacterium]